LNLFLGSSLVLGGTVSTAPPGTFPQQPFGFTGPDIPGGDILTPTLEIVTLSSVPEPATVLLIVIGSLALGCHWRHRRGTV